MKFRRINGSKHTKRKIQKYQPITLKKTKFSKRNLLSSCDQVILHNRGITKKQKIEKIISCPYKQNKNRKILTKSTVVGLSSGLSAKIITKVRHKIPHAELFQ